MTQPTIIDITATSADWLARAEGVHRQLRPQLPSPYTEAMQAVFASGAAMTIATFDQTVVGLAVWRASVNTFSGANLYIDDLVTDAALRSRGIGRALLNACEAHARRLGCTVIRLDSGVQREQAHRFYFREGYTIACFNFEKAIARGP